MKAAAPEERLEAVRVAYHEAAHVVVAVELGGLVVGPASIARTGQWLGVAHVRARRGRAGRIVPGRAVLSFPAGMRRRLETAAMIDLAGAIGELYAPSVQRDIPPDIAVDYPADSPAVAPLTRADQRMLAVGDQPDVSQSDFDHAFECLEQLVGQGDRAFRYVAFLEAETAAVLRGERAQTRLHRVAAALLAHETLSARAVRALLEEPES